ncbi:MAG: hypothetical protein GY834_14305 [Bacteroidetes bacterium]|nr:hypothetical protein [Bacteroidota bacterium]
MKTNEKLNNYPKQQLPFKGKIDVIDKKEATKGSVVKVVEKHILAAKESGPLF